MRKIVRPGYKEFKTQCTNCGCRFTYEREDILKSASQVKCPECEKAVWHDATENGVIHNA